MDLAPAPKGLRTPEKPTRGTFLLPPGYILSTCETWEGPPNTLTTISPNGWGGPAVPEQSLARSFHRVFQARSAGLPQAAGQMLGSWGVLSAEGGPGHSSGCLNNHDIKMQAPRNLPGRGFSQTHRPRATGGVELQDTGDSYSGH